MFRREWRRQILVTALLTVAVAAAIGSITIVHNSDAADDAEHGSASHLLRFDGSRPRTLETGLDAAGKWFGRTEVIGYRSFVVPGGVEKVEFRAQDPRGVYGSAMLALRQGSYPVGARQVAVTEGVADLLALELGDVLSLDGQRRTIVGIVENPRDLTDEFALVSPASAGAPDRVTVLVQASGDSIRGFFTHMENDGRSALVGSVDGPSGQSAGTLAMFSVATVFLLLASLVAAAGFAVIAQRRLRQLGMLSAIGATQKHLRLVLLTNGAVVGAIGAALGTVLGLGLWFAIVPTLETAVDHRIHRLDLPWTLLAAAVLVAVLGATAAAWWPGRAAARVPVVLALSARPPRPKPAHRSAGVAGIAARGGNQQPRVVQPEHPGAHHRRGPGDDSRHAAPRSTGDPHPRPGGRARSRRPASGAAGPRPLPGQVRSGTRRDHPGTRHRSGGRHHRGRRGEAAKRAGGRRAAQPVRPPDPGVLGRHPRAGPRSFPAPNTRRARAERGDASASSQPVWLPQP